LNGLANTFDEASAALSYLMSPGKGWPSYFAMPGFGSKRSMWLGPPIMNKEIMARARDWSGGTFGDRSNLWGPMGGLRGAARRPSSRKSQANPKELRLKELALRKCRREQKEFMILN
jgi:hypothetical protein